MSGSPVVLRRLEAKDALLFARLAATDPWRWATARMNIEGFGFQNSYMTLWGAFTQGETALCGILTRFTNTVVVVDAAGECAPLFADMINEEPGIAGVRGASETVAALFPRLSRYQVSAQEDSFYMVLRQPPRRPLHITALARPLRSSDLEKVVALYAAAGPMYRSRATLTPKIGCERAFGVEEASTLLRPARLASCALMNSEGEEAGMIGGVFTLPDARGKGYAEACVAALSEDLQNSGKTPTLFYENPVAGRIYRRMGFETAGVWKLLYLVPKITAK